MIRILEVNDINLPVIIFNNPALSSVIFAPECGYFVEDWNSEELAKVIEFLINNEEEREKGEI